MRTAPLLALVLASACGSPGAAPAPGAATPPPSVTATGTGIDVAYSSSRGVVTDVVEAPKAVAL